MKTISTCILLAVLPCQAVHADLINVLLGKDVADSTIDNVTSGWIIRQGLTITLTANLGVLNATGSSYGINASGSDDESALLDGPNGMNKESITITFDRAVTFTQLTLGDYAHNGVVPEMANLTLGLNGAISLPPTSDGLDVYDFTSANFLAIGQPAIISYVSGNGFSLEGIQVRTVPEPTTFTLSGLAIVGLMFRRRDRGLRAR